MTKEDKKVDPLDDLAATIENEEGYQYNNRLQKEAEYAREKGSNNNNKAPKKTGRKPIAKNLKQDIKKTVYLNKDQEKFLQKKSRETGINESNYIRSLILKAMKAD